MNQFTQLFNHLPPPDTQAFPQHPPQQQSERDALRAGRGG